jgi:hypothetical protein
MLDCLGHALLIAAHLLPTKQRLGNRRAPEALGQCTKYPQSPAMPRRTRRTRKPGKDDLRSFQRFSGMLSDGDRSIPMRFKARIGEDGEVELDIQAFRITKANWFVRERFQAGRNDVAEFVLSGVTADGLRFESDSLSFNSLGSRFSGVHNRHWSKPRGECGKVQYFRTLEPARERPFLKLHLKRFDCFPPLYATCALGKIQVVGETKLSEADEQPADIGVWRAEAEKFAEHLRRILSVAASTMLQAPILEFAADDGHEIEVLSQSRQHAPLMRVFHKLNLQPVLDAAIVSFFNPPVEAKNLFFAIEWFAMATTYNEVRLVNAMTALENLIDSNLTQEEALIEPKREFDKTRKVLRKVIRACLERWSPDRAEAAREELGEKLLDLNRRSLRRKLYLLATRWNVPLDGISDSQIAQAIKARNAIVHSGHHPTADDGPDLWDHMTIVRELVVRFLLTAIGYRGQYISHVGGYRFAHFPPVSGEAEAPSDEPAVLEEDQ